MSVPADLGLVPVTGRDRTGDPLAEVREAIRVERRVQRAPVSARIYEVDCLDPDEGLWRLVVGTGRRRGREVDWRGARLQADMLSGGWGAQVLDAQHGVVLVHLPPPDRPRVGQGDVHPFDFLRAPATLLNSPGFQPVHDRFRRCLEAAVGWRRGRPLPGPAGPWASSWGLLWGPPGTGKTHTLVRRVAALLDQPHERILVVSTTNRATDDVALRLAAHLDRRRDLMRRYGRVDPRRYQAEGLLDVVAGADTVQEISHLDASLDRARSSRERARTTLVRRRLLGRVPRLADILDDDAPRVAVTTLHSALRALVSSAGQHLVTAGRAPFTTVVVDEAGLIPRATAAAVGLLAARRVVLVGDPRQLSPICVAARSLQPAVKRWLALSGLEGADPESPHVRLLTTQHRMHPDVRATVSRLSYDDRLADAPSIPERAWPKGGRLAHFPRALHVVLDDGDDIATGAERVERGSWIRPRGLDVFRSLLTGYPELRAAEGLFITPYRAQAEHARAVVEDAGLAGWTCSTAHAQQGAEADVVVFDVVKMGGWPPPEFRRLVNVALSRARQMVILLATTRELEARWLRAIRPTLARFAVRRGQLVSLDATEQGGLFERRAPDPRVDPHAPPTATWTGPIPADRAADRPVSRDPSRLGEQIRARRAGRRTLTRQQELLVSRRFKDLGPRLVRGVAGSGKTIVLARWAAVELSQHPDRTATVLFGNHSLAPHLDDLLRRSWSLVRPEEGFPEDRVQLLHVGELLRGLLAEHRIPPPDEPWDYLGHVQALSEVDVPGPRFELLYIDEAQDFGHEVLELLLGLVDRTDGLPVRIFYDNAQNVYGRSMPVWSSFGLDMRGRSEVLRENFRTTREATELALNLLDRVAPLAQDRDLTELRKADLLEQDAEGRWRANFCVASGQAPEVEVFDRRADEEQALAERVRAWRDDGVRNRDIRVLAIGEDRCARVVQRLSELGVPAVSQRGRRFDPTDDRVVVTTPHGFKGYEAEVVAVCGLDAFANHESVWTPLIWVALTRAQTLLRVSATAVGDGHSAQGLVASLEEEARRARDS